MNLPRVWWIVGVILVLIALVVCLVPGREIPGAFEFNDKVSHLAGHGLLAVYFSALVPRRRWWKIFVFLLLFGAAVEVADDRQSGPAAAAERLEQQTQVRAAVQELPETLRTVVVLHYSGGLSLRQVAAAMELNVGTVKSRLNSALAQMRARLRPFNESGSQS